MNKVFLDSDGVMADFEAYFADYFGYRHDSVTDEKMWEDIESHPNFFGSLPFMEGALEFYDWLCETNKERPIILTACPKTSYKRAAIQKIEWYKRLDKNLHVLPMLGGKNKCLFMHRPGDILIDDFIKNLKPWTNMGGISIHHKNFMQTKQEFLKATANNYLKIA